MLLAIMNVAASADPANSPASSGTQPLPPAPTASQLLPPVPVAPYSWAGLYIRGTNDLAAAAQGDSANAPDLFSASSISATSVNGGLSSGEIGANWQNGHTVVGFESDMQWSDQWASPLSGCGLGCSLNDHVRVPWFAAFRANAGEAFDRLYLYGTGGFSTTGSADTLNPAGGGLPNFTDLSAGSLRWTIGGGMQYAVDQDVTAKLEFLHKTPVTGATDSVFDSTTNSSIKNDVVRGGFDYRIPIGQ
jgi:outer membrane immunogenic protein